MATTYKAIATVTVGSGGAANIEFTSIPATYTDLVIHLSGRTTRNDTADDIGIELNNVTPTGFPDSSGNYTNRRLLGYSGSTSGVDNSKKSSTSVNQSQDNSRTNNVKNTSNTNVRQSQNNSKNTTVNQSQNNNAYQLST